MFFRKKIKALQDKISLLENKISDLNLMYCEQAKILGEHSDKLTSVFRRQDEQRETLKKVDSEIKGLKDSIHSLEYENKLKEGEYDLLEAELKHGVKVGLKLKYWIVTKYWYGTKCGLGCDKREVIVAVVNTKTGKSNQLTIDEFIELKNKKK